jgi:transcription antitermination factor NusG
MAVLEEMAHENDWQMLVEVVDTSGKVGIYMEEGEVIRVNADPSNNELAKVEEPKKNAAKKRAKVEAKQVL